MDISRKMALSDIVLQKLGHVMTRSNEVSATSTVSEVSSIVIGTIQVMSWPTNWLQNGVRRTTPHKEIPSAHLRYDPVWNVLKTVFVEL